MKVAFQGYRPWANKIFDNLKGYKEEYNPAWEIADINKADIVLYYGWSWPIPQEIYENRVCLILHPSPLPKYRGGSPIQHQIIAGEKYSAVTIFRARKKIDSGEIYSQTGFILDGSLDDIFAKIVDIGTSDTIDLLNAMATGINTPISGIPQDESQATTFKRRYPSESEIKNIETKTAEELYNFIRALQDPYPEPFIKCKDGKKLYITGAHL